MDINKTRRHHPIIRINDTIRPYVFKPTDLCNGITLDGDIRLKRGCTDSVNNIPITYKNTALLLLLLLFF